MHCWQGSTWAPALWLSPPPPPWACCQALPHTASMTHLTPPNGTPPHIQAHPYASASDPHHPPKLFHPLTTSPLFHIPRGALVKSNPIIRHSAVQEKKENFFPVVHSRLPFFFPTSHLFTPSGGKMTLWAPLASCLCLSSGLIYPFFLSLAPSFPLLLLFFCQWYKPLCWV